MLYDFSIHYFVDIHAREGQPFVGRLMPSYSPARVPSRINSEMTVSPSAYWRRIPMEQSGQVPLTAVRWSRIPATPKGSFTKSYDKNELINKTRSFLYQSEHFSFGPAIRKIPNLNIMQKTFIRKSKAIKRCCAIFICIFVCKFFQILIGGTVRRLDICSR